MSEPKELEKIATAYASDAVQFEKQGEKEKAILLYQKAIDSLNQLVQRYPKYGFSKIYNERSIAYQERIKELQATSTNSDSEISFSESQESTEKVAIQSESSIDLATILQEINKKIDQITGSITELKEDVQTLKLNVNDALGKTEQTHKEVAEIRNLVYSIKYDR